MQIGTGFRFVTAGRDHTVAVKSDGTLWAWGLNADGQIGDGTTAPRHAPVQIGSGFATAAAAGRHAVALKGDGSLWAWGNNGDGQLGDSTRTSRLTPVQIGSAFASVAAGLSQTLATSTSLWQWGTCQLGSPAAALQPVQIAGRFAAVATRSDHTVAIDADGRLWAWGVDTNGQLGDGGGSSSVPLPVSVP